ncbi:MAG: protease modulator HflC, partial [Verrucomicrobiae bacterium]|nr:protease modulator HflC [Verrucomicrobiae bacterium]
MSLPSNPDLQTSNRRGSALLILIVFLVVVAGFALKFSLYTVREWEQAVVLQFGEVIGEPTTDPGLHFKLPWQNVEHFDSRLLRWDGNQTTTITRDRRTVNVDVTARWRINDAKRFREAIGSIYQADSRLNGLIQGAVKDEIAKFELFEVVRSSNRILDAGDDVSTANLNTGEENAISADELATLGADLPRLSTDPDGNYRAGRPIVLQGILREARRRIEQVNLGIYLEDVLIKQLGYIQEIEANVYAQMNAELEKIAAGFRSTGRERAEQRLGEMQRELAVIESSGIERAQRIRGEA